jgi:diguanylate cyclase (GGDEF)-like protein
MMSKLLYLAYLLMLIPTVTDWVEVGHLPRTKREMITEVIMALIVAAMVWGINQLHRRVVLMAETDGLTRINNRLKFQADLAGTVGRAQRLETELMLVYLDIDRFKSINDRYGHHAGDHILREMAGCLKASVREETDRCYRIGGDEFAILMEANDINGIVGIQRRMAEVREKLCLILSPFNAGVSMGTAALQLADTPEMLLERADFLMYREKNSHAQVDPQEFFFFPKDLVEKKQKS